jgi:uncharacterized membrane protein HdeD (DUF308 family)
MQGMAPAGRREAAMLANILSRYWWMTLLRGVVWILFGLVVFAQPGISLVALTFMFGAFALVDGIATLVTAIGGRRENENWWVLLLVGFCGVAAGIVTFLAPGITALALLFFIATWAIATGVLEIVAAIRLRKEIRGEFWLALAGALSVAFGVLLIANPGAGALSVLWLIGFYAIVFGLSLILLSLKVRGFVNRVVAARA